MISASLRASAFAACLLALAACATAPGAPPPATGAAQPALPTRGFGEMQPIPNPESDTQPGPPRAPRPSAPPRAARPAPAPASPPSAPRETAPRAASLRAQGLEQLNRGAVDRAVALLQQAKALDPNNALIQRDLDRALRIGRAVKGK